MFMCLLVHLEIVNYVYPESYDYANESTPVTVDIMNLFTNLFEEYPFSNEKYGSTALAKNTKIIITKTNTYLSIVRL